MVSVAEIVGVSPLDALTGALLAGVIVSWLLLLVTGAQALRDVRWTVTAPLAVAVLTMFTGNTVVVSRMLLALISVWLGVLCFEMLSRRTARLCRRSSTGITPTEDPLPTLETLHWCPASTVVENTTLYEQ